MSRPFKYHSLKFKRVFRYSPSERVYRLFRWVWQKGQVGDGKGFSSKFSVSLVPRLFRFAKDNNTGNGWYVTVLGLRLHHQWNFGGIDT